MDVVLFSDGFKNICKKENFARQTMVIAKELTGWNFMKEQEFQNGHVMQRTTRLFVHVVAQLVASIRGKRLLRFVNHTATTTSTTTSTTPANEQQDFRRLRRR